MAVQHVDVIERDVQRGHHGVRDAQVYQEVISDCTHPFVGHHYPNHYQITTGGNYDHTGEQ